MEPEERIIQLIDGELGASEMAELEKLISDNPELTDLKERYEQIVLAIQKDGERTLRKELDGYLKDHLEKQSTGKSSSFKRYFLFGGIAAAIALTIVVFRPGEVSNDEVPINWQINDIPAHADSAVFQADSLKNKVDSLKINED